MGCGSSKQAVHEPVKPPPAAHPSDPTGATDAANPLAAALTLRVEALAKSGDHKVDSSHPSRSASDTPSDRALGAGAPPKDPGAGAGSSTRPKSAVSRSIGPSPVPGSVLTSKPKKSVRIAAPKDGSTGTAAEGKTGAQPAWGSVPASLASNSRAGSDGESDYEDDFDELDDSPTSRKSAKSAAASIKSAMSATSARSQLSAMTTASKKENPNVPPLSLAANTNANANATVTATATATTVAAGSKEVPKDEFSEIHAAPPPSAHDKVVSFPITNGKLSATPPSSKAKSNPVSLLKQFDIEAARTRPETFAEWKDLIFAAAEFYGAHHRFTDRYISSLFLSLAAVHAATAQEAKQQKITVPELTLKKSASLGAVERMLAVELGARLETFMSHPDSKNAFQLLAFSGNEALFDAVRRSGRPRRSDAEEAEAEAKRLAALVRKAPAPESSEPTADPNKLSLTSLKQFVVHCPTEDAKVSFISDMFLLTSRKCQAVVFAPCKEMGDRIVETLRKDGWPKSAVAVLDRGMSSKEQMAMLKDFTARNLKIIVTANDLSRQFLALVPLVINFEPIDDRVTGVNGASKTLTAYETYMHRVGRNAEFKRKGAAFNLWTTEAERLILEKVESYYFVNKMPSIKHIEEKKLEAILKSCDLT